MYKKYAEENNLLWAYFCFNMSAAYFHVNIRGGISICSTIYSQLTLLRPSAPTLKEKEAKKDLASSEGVSVQELTSYVHASADNRKGSFPVI